MMNAPIMTQRKRQIIMEEAMRAGIDWREIKGYRRTAPVVNARHRAMRRMRVELGMSFAAIGQYMGRDHSTVCSAMRKFQGDIQWVAAPSGKWSIGLPAGLAQ